MTVPLTAKKITLLRFRKDWKASPGKSIWCQWFNLNFMNRREYFLYAKKSKITTKNVSTICLLSVSPRLHRILDIIHRTQAAYALLHLPQWKKRLICIFFAYKKYLRQFIKFRLNHWWQMDFPGDAFHFFLDLNGVIFLAVKGTVTSLPVFI